MNKQKSSLEHRTKKIWIDLDNSPHVLFFNPIIKELKKRGYQVVLTARDYAQVCGLADLFNLEYKPIGHHYGKNKILLVTLPFWSPLIPSQGIAVLKSFLQRFGYRVKAIDATSENLFLEFYNTYFQILKDEIPLTHRGNFYNIGHDVLRNHMMAYTNQTNQDNYYELIQLLIFHTYYHSITDKALSQLNESISKLFTNLSKFILSLLNIEKPDLLGLSVNSGNL